MKIAVDTSDIAHMISADEITDMIAAQLEEVIEDIYTDLIASPPLGTPVDTGEARNSWQIDTSVKLAPEVYSMSPYMGGLNDGLSKQSPPGFVDASVDKHIR